MSHSRSAANETWAHSNSPSEQHHQTDEVHIAQAMMSLLWGPLTIGRLVIDALTRRLKEKASFGPVVPLGKNGEAGEAHFSKAVCLQATDYIMLVK